MPPAPELLILDEPTSGLDPLMEAAFRETVGEARGAGCTVFLSSHILSEVEALCDRVGILSQGKLVEEGTLAELRHLSQHVVEATFSGEPPVDRPPRSHGAAGRAGHAPLFGAWIGGAAGRCASPAPGVVSMVSREPSLEELFLAHYNRGPDMDDRHSNRPTRWILQSSLRLERVRLAVIGLIMVLNAVGNVIGYRDTYPDEASRQQFAAAFQGNLALRLFYGIPRDLASVGGYVEFRVVGMMAVLAAAWAVFAAARALRGEEDAGRWELVLCR